MTILNYNFNEKNSNRKIEYIIIYKLEIELRQ